MIVRKFLLLFVSAFCLSSMAETNPTHLVVWAKDGTKVSYLLNESPKVTFSDYNLVIKTDGVEVNYELSQMLRLTYENDEFTKIVNVEGKMENPFTFNGETLMFEASDTELSVRIVSSDGILVLSREVKKGNTLAVPVSRLANGYYVVKVNGITYKILKK